MKNKKIRDNEDNDREGRLKSALSYCYRLLNYKPYTESEIANKIAAKFGEDIVDDVVLSLKNAKLIDDQLYIKLWVTSRVNSHPEGISVMKYKLRNKGIPEQLIEEYFSKNEIDESDMVRRVIDKKRKHYGAEKNKLYRYLLQKGFRSEVISRVIKECF